MRQLDIFTLTERQLEVAELPKYVGKWVRLIGLHEGDKSEMYVRLKEVSDTPTGVFVTLEPRKDGVSMTLWIRDDQPTRLWVRKARKE